MLVPVTAGLWSAMEGVLWWQSVLAGGFRLVGAPPRDGRLATHRLLLDLVRLWACVRRARGVLPPLQWRHVSRLAARGFGRVCSVTAGRTLLLATLFAWLRCGLTLPDTLTALVAGV